MERTKKKIDMDYEKKYNEALGWMRQLYPCLYGQFREDAEHFFPELKESGDKWFIKELQGFLDSYGADYFGTGEWQKFHVWLENQKEPHYTKRNALFDKCVANCNPEIMKKVSDEVDEKQKEQNIPKPHKGDDSNPYDMSFSEAQEYASNRRFDIPFNDGEVFIDERYITQTIGNILRWADEHPKEQKTANGIDADVSLTTNDEQSKLKAVGSVYDNIHNAMEQKPADDEAKAIAYREYERGRENGLRDGQKYVLDNAESYGLCKPAEWSDEDEKNRRNLMSLLANMRGDRITEETYQKYYPWLKDLRSRPKPSDNWKPSGEQPQVADASKMEPEGIDAVVSHREGVHYIAANTEQLNARLKQFDEGAKVLVYIEARKED